jgi:hypothetical protein
MPNLTNASVATRVALELLGPLEAIVQVRVRGGGGGEWWETIAAFNVAAAAKDLARDYWAATVRMGDTGPLGYRVVNLAGKVIATFGVLR